MDVIKILEKMEELNMIRTNRVIGNYMQCYCPLHSNGNEKHPSSGILLNEEYRNGQTYPEGFFHCFSCGKAMSLPNLIEEILKEKNISNRSGLEWLKENVGEFKETEFDYLLPRNIIQDLNNNFALNYIKSKTQQQREYVSEEELKNYRYTIQYMYERKLTDEVIEKFDVGVDLHYVPAEKVREVPCITFPVRDINGNVLFIYRRAINTKNFYMPAGIEKPVYGIYELPKDSSRVILCESIFNALTCYVYGYPALALFGTGTASQLNQLKLLGVKEFILGLDPDEAGERGATKLKKALKSVSIIRKMNIPQGKDINDLDFDTFKKCYDLRI